VARIAPSPPKTIANASYDDRATRVQERSGFVGHALEDEPLAAEEPGAELAVEVTAIAVPVLRTTEVWGRSGAQRSTGGPLKRPVEEPLVAEPPPE
jgi:hypothetical protein